MGRIADSAIDRNLLRFSKAEDCLKMHELGAMLPRQWADTEQ